MRVARKKRVYAHMGDLMYQKKAIYCDICLCLPFPGVLLREANFQALQMVKATCVLANLASFCGPCLFSTAKEWGISRPKSRFYGGASAHFHPSVVSGQVCCQAWSFNGILPTPFCVSPFSPCGQPRPLIKQQMRLDSKPVPCSTMTGQPCVQP